MAPESSKMAEPGPKERGVILAEELLSSPQRALAAATEIAAIIGPGGPESQQSAQELLEVPGKGIVSSKSLLMYATAA